MPTHDGNTPHTATKIPRGVILDLLDLYGLEIEVVCTYLENYRYKPPLKLNQCYQELKDEILLLVTKWKIGKWNSNRLINDSDGLSTFYIPFDSDLISEVAYRNQPESIWDEWELDATGIMATMHGTRKLLKILLKSERVYADYTKRDDDIQETVTNTKCVLEELSTERKYGVSTPQSKSRTKAEMEAEREEETKRMKVALGEAYELFDPGSIYEKNRNLREAGIDAQILDSKVISLEAIIGDIKYHYDSAKATQKPELLKTTSTTRTIIFNEGLPGIVVDGKDCSLARLSDQLKVARVMLSGGSSVGDKHHWETIYKKISKTPLADRGHKGPQKEKIKEAALGINKKIKKISGVNENIFKWSGAGYLVRNF